MTVHWEEKQAALGECSFWWIPREKQCAWKQVMIWKAFSYFLEKGDQSVRGWISREEQNIRR